ncbi:hypothetical protein AURDEDRAFT_113597 [Auricularia subglabra TFB-10046 SS5]|nr:hypothetical protein AURDEDRAFT_113597 [Auricularia subglabra TFB-10046 SS5]
MSDSFTEKGDLAGATASSQPGEPATHTSLHHRVQARNPAAAGDEGSDDIAELPLHDADGGDGKSERAPPSFAQSQLHTIIRRQILRPRDGSGVKVSRRPSRFANLPVELGFAGWGKIQWTALSPEDIASAEKRICDADAKILGQWVGAAVVGNDLLGSVFYAFPAVSAVAGIYSPISLFIATCILFIFRPIMIELASAIPVSGSNYMYLLNSTKRYVALAAATITLLDNLATAVVSAATSTVYIEGDVDLPFSPVWLTVILLLLFSIVAASGLRESASLAFVILAIHVVTMIALMLASIVSWARHGNAVLTANWAAARPPGVADALRSIFYGVCLSFLGMTGFECTPDYLSNIKRGRYPRVLRNLLWPAVFLNGPLMLLVFASLPAAQITGSANILSRLGGIVAGRWMRIWIVVDACICLCAGILTGIISNIALFERLTRDRVLPNIIMRPLPRTGAQGVSIVVFLALCCILYATSAGKLEIVSLMFATAFLAVVGLFALSLLMVNFHRGRIPRSPRTSVWIISFALLLVLAMLGGNIALDPRTIGYFAAYFIALFGVLCLFANPVTPLQWAYWLLDQVPSRGWVRRFAERIAGTITRLRHKPVACLVKTDQIDTLLEMMLYVQDNEPTSCVKIVHFYANSIDTIPSELEANTHIIDEAFPHITVDLLFVQAAFTPAAVEALSHKLGIRRNMMFMRSFSESFPYEFDEMGTRIIGL